MGCSAKCCYQLGCVSLKVLGTNWQEMMVAQPAVVQTPQMMYQPPQVTRSSSVVELSGLLLGEGEVCFIVYLFAHHCISLMLCF
jgi:hypothetical protein